MAGRSHDTSYPHSSDRYAANREPNCFPNRFASKPLRGAAPKPVLRPRISHHDADRLTLRLREAGRAAGLAGIAGEVLDAVEELLAGWKRLRDDRVQLRQIVDLCPSHPHPRTVARSLARMDRLEIVHYTPARGRGATATIAVHERLTDGIHELERDADGAVIVPFSRPHTSSSPKENPPTPHASGPHPRQPHRSRPTEVEVDPRDVRRVVDDLPAVLATLPTTCRPKLGAAIRHQLARGYYPEQILQVLHAPLPEHVDRPLRLALWRLAINQPGSGPRLLPLQRQWDRFENDRQRREQDTAAAADYQRVTAITTAVQRQAMMTAISRLFGPTTDPKAAVITACRRARRQFPHLHPAAAITAWLAHGDTTQPIAAGTAAAGTDRGWEPPTTNRAEVCISCAQIGKVRHELPLQSVVCDDCWHQAAA